MMKLKSQKRLNDLLILANFLCFFLPAMGQTIIKGEVKDGLGGDPLIGASILVKGTTIGTVTDFDGAFELRTELSLPITLNVSYTGFNAKEIEVANTDATLKITLEEGVITTEVIEVKGQRISEKQKASPLTVESLDVLAIKQTPSDNFYDGLGSLKGVDLTAASLGFKIINTRGFNSTSPVRSLQIIDGVDNQAPGLNFSLGNFLGSPELDVLKVDVIVGASSAFYGPNAFNGVISMVTKNPFLQKGLSVMGKVGERDLYETSVRWADALKNKNGHDFLAYKINFSYMQAYDWEADNYDPVYDTDTGIGNPGGYDAVNIYGDEYYNGNDFSTFAVSQYPGLGIWHRTGYREIDLVDYNTNNLKASAAVHLRTSPEKDIDSPELILNSSFGTGTTVYQGDNRFRLENILFFNNRIEFRKQDKYFFRVYATHENAGDSYDPFFTALKLQQASKTNFRWSQDYVDYWLVNVNNNIKNAEGFPKLIIEGFDPITGMVISSFDLPAANQWLADNNDLVTEYHRQSAEYANGETVDGTRPFYQPGTARFDAAFKNITTQKRTEGGTLFTDQSALYHAHGEYKINSGYFDEITLGANSRYYTPNSEGTIFYDTGGVNITNFEFGMYAGLQKQFNGDRWRASATLRADKNENFDWLFSPAASIVWKPTANNYLRLSFSSAIRNPTLTDQFLSLNVGPAILSGNLNGVKGLVTIESLEDWLEGSLRPDLLRYFDINPIKPENVKTFEVGYRTTLFNTVYVDAGYYYNVYNNFIGYQLGADLEIDRSTGRPGNITVYRYSANSQNTVTTQGASLGLNFFFKRYYMISSNYSWNKLIKSFEDDPIIPAYNTPEHKYNIGISGRDVPIKIGKRMTNNFGFSINYKWIEGFLFEGSPQFTGFVPTYDLLDAQVNYQFDKINTTLKIGASNLLDNQQFQTYGGPRIGRLAYLSLLFEFVKK